jgi:tRNA A-37 threonylcarbamoyl transferase component Bud32
MSLSLDGIEWHFQSETGAAWLDGLAAPRLEAALLKSSTRRGVWRLPDATIVKEVRYPGVLRSLLKTVSGGNACREGSILMELARRGVAVPEVMAYGTECRTGILSRDLLITREVPGGKSLLAFMQENYALLPFAEKNRLVRDLAGFIKGLHDKGVLHRDLHIGNLIYRAQAETDPFVLLDVDRVRLQSAGLTPTQRADNLAVLLCNFWSLGSTPAIFRFLRCYGLHWQTPAERRLLAHIRNRSLRLASRSWNAHARHCLTGNAGFVPSRHGSFRIYRLRRPDAEQALADLLPDPDRVLERGEILKAGRTVTAAKVELGGRAYFLKRYNCKGWFYRVRNAVRRSRAVRTWMVTWGLRLRHLPVPEPLICLEERRWRLLQRSYLLSEFIADAQPLATLWPPPQPLREIADPQGGAGETPQKGSAVPAHPTSQARSNPPAAPDASARIALLVDTAILLGRLHRYGAVHGDLKWANLLVHRHPGKPTVILTDLDGAHLIKHRLQRRAAGDLERFLRDLQQRDPHGQYRKPFVDAWRRWSNQAHQD